MKYSALFMNTLKYYFNSNNMEYKYSWLKRITADINKVNKLFIDSRIRGISSITIENHVKYKRNRQVEGTMCDNTFQPKDILTTFALANDFMDAGKHSVIWDASGLSAGVYFYTVKSGDFSKTMKMTLLK